jgi:hypothetical protein
MLVPSLRTILAQIPSGPWLDTLRNAPVTVLVMTVLLAVFFLVSLILLTVKSSALSSCRKADSNLIASFRGSAHPLAMLQNGEQHDLSPLFSLYLAGARELSFHLLGTDTVDKDFLTRLRAAGKIVPAQLHAVREAIHHQVMEESLRLEGRVGGISAFLRTLPWLAALTPLGAWLETQTSSADVVDPASRQTLLLSLAPVALALVGTVFCQLMVHLLGISVRRERLALAKFAIELSNVFDRHYVDYRQPMEQLPSISSFGPPDSPSLSLPPGDHTTSGRSPSALTPPA